MHRRNPDARPRVASGAPCHGVALETVTDHHVRIDDSLEITDSVSRVVEYVRLAAVEGVAVASASAAVVKLGPAHGPSDSTLDLTAGPPKFKVTVSSPGWLAPRALTGGEYALIGVLSALCADFAEAQDAEPGVVLLTGLLVFLLLREFTRRFLDPFE